MRAVKEHIYETYEKRDLKNNWYDYLKIKSEINYWEFNFKRPYVYNKALKYYSFYANIISSFISVIDPNKTYHVNSSPLIKFMCKDLKSIEFGNILYYFKYSLI